MIPSLRRCLQAALAAGLVGGAQGALAQSAAPAGQPAAASQSKASPPKSDTARRKAAAKADAAKGPKLDAAAAQGEVENGINALGQGRLDAAVSSLSTALSAGSLPSAQTARALYYRGVAYRRQSKPAQAISDLTNALWIKAGLTEEQRADALQQRSGAYREAGLPDQADPPGARTAGMAKAGSASTPFAAVAPPAPTGSSTSLSGSGGGFFSSLFGGGTSNPPAPAAAAAPKAAPVPATTASIAPRTAAAPATGTAAASSDGTRPATRMVPIYSSGSSLPMGFQDVGDTVRHVEVSTTARAPQPQPATPAVAVAKSWENATKVKQGPAAATRAPARDTPPAAGPPAAVAAAVPPPPAAVPKGKAAAGAVPPASGSIRIQVAAVRSAEEAKGVSTRLQSQFGQELGGRAPVVDQVSAGNFGMFYRVQVGPYASVRDTEGLCAKLKSGGLDCRVVGN